MKSKIIIENTSELSLKEAMDRVDDVMWLGFISGENQYCYVSTFTDCVVYARETRGTTHSFKVIPNDK
ncbi:MAG: hypothetical protein ACJASL_000149 [Paraglaciecola sp.]|jgi:hypothetical protein